MQRNSSGLPMTVLARLAGPGAALLIAAAPAAAATQDAPIGGTPAQPDPAAPAEDPLGDLLGGGGTGQDAPAVQDKADKPDAAPATVRLPSPVMNPGTTLRFSLVSTDETRGGAGEVTRTSRQAIELKVLPRKAKVRTIRYVIRSGEVDGDPLGAAMLNASRDLATDYEADAAGKPLRLADWTGVRAAMLKKLITDVSAPVAGVQRVQAALNSMDAVSAIPFAIPETLMVSDMQGWPPLSPGPHQDADGGAVVGGRQARLLSSREVGSPDKAACTVRLVRTTNLDPASPASAGGAEADQLRTEAEVSTVDGWVVRLTQTRTHRSGPASQVRTWTLTRDDPPPCG